MSWLFKIEGKKVFPNAETLLIHPFKDIWERDTSKDKWLAINELAYIEFMTSMLSSNPFKGYEKKIREEKIISNIFEDKKWRPDKLVNKGIEVIDELQTNGSSAYRSYKTALNVKNKSEDMINSFDLNERTTSGALVLKPKDVGDALINYGKITIEMENLRKKVEEELYDTIKTRGNIIVSPFEDID